MLPRRMFLQTLLTLPLAGCVATGTKVHQTQLATFTPGETTYYDVVAALGKPNYETKQANGPRQVVYTYTQGQLNWMTFVPIASALARGSTSETTQVTLDFDAREVLVTYQASQGQTTSGQGLISGARQ